MKSLLRILGFFLTVIPLILIGYSFQFRMIFIFILEIVSLIGWELIVVKLFVEDDFNFIKNLIIYICLWPIIIALIVIVHHLVFSPV